MAWGRAVKARRGGRLPPLWLFSDAVRAPDLMAAVAALPVGLFGVVFRHDGAPERQALLERVARSCRERRVALVVAGEGQGAPAWAGRHLRGGVGPRRGPHRRRRLVTSSAHDRAELVRARRAGASLAFLSPVFATASHPGARPLGPIRWGAMARAARLPVFALGGVTGETVARLPRGAPGAGAIGAFLA